MKLVLEEGWLARQRRSYLEFQVEENSARHCVEFYMKIGWFFPIFLFYSFIYTYIYSTSIHSAYYVPGPMLSFCDSE